MPPKSPEDIIQAIYDAALQAIRISAGADLLCGVRVHRERAGVATTYAPATNSLSFSGAVRHVRVYAQENIYWVDSAADDTDAESRLSTADQRGFLKAGSVLEMHLVDGITRLDFLAKTTSGAVYVTGCA